MKKYNELINKKMELGELLNLINSNYITTPSILTYEDGMRNGLVSTDIEKDSHTNIFFKYIDSLEEYTKLVNEASKGEFFNERLMSKTNIIVTKIEYWTKN